MHTSATAARNSWYTVCLAATIAAAPAARAEEAILTSPWNVSVAAGLLDLEGDVPVTDAPLVAVRIGHDRSTAWTFEGEFALAPQLDENFRHTAPGNTRISRLQENAGPGVDDTWSMRASAAVLYHMAPNARLDPFLAAGAGAAWYADGFDRDLQPMILGGVGCLYHLGDAWALRADARFSFSDQDTEASGTYLVGLQWAPTSRSASAPALPVAAPTQQVPQPAPVAAPAPATIPVDTDHDGLTDTEETETTHTDPLRADTDWDALSDGDEVHKHSTDPLKRDTDAGGVYDGHEIIEDGTKPTERADDLQVFELQFDYEPNDWHIKSEYFSEIGVIAKILLADPTATARIEGHVDAIVEDADALAEKRAQAVRDALVTDWKIEATRLNAVGYGTSRPKGPSTPPAGNPANSRVEVYLPAQTK